MLQINHKKLPTSNVRVTNFKGETYYCIAIFIYIEISLFIVY